MNRTFAGAMRTVVAACLALLAAVLLQPGLGRGAYPPPDDPFDFNEAVVQQAGPEVMVYDWSTQKCENDDIPDEAARAFRDNTGKINLMDTHFWNYRFTATTARPAPYTHPCTRTMSSTNSADPATYNSKEWLASPWTADGQTVYALIHNEYQGGNFLSNCGVGLPVLVELDHERRLHRRRRDLQQHRARPHGGHDPVPVHQGRSARLLHAEQHRALRRRLVLRDVPRRGQGRPADRHLPDAHPRPERPPVLARLERLDASRCGSSTPTSRPPASTRPTTSARRWTSTASGRSRENLFYNTYFKKWVLVGNSVGDSNFPDKPPGVYYALSDDLLNWTDLKLLMAAEITWARNCVLPDPIKEVSILDPSSTSRNFTTVGQNAQLFYTWYHMSGCNGTLDRDLVRIPIQFTDPTP